jgi:hypothetical protein
MKDLPSNSQNFYLDVWLEVIESSIPLAIVLSNEATKSARAGGIFVSATSGNGCGKIGSWAAYADT